MRKIKIFLSGPMTGLPNFNRDAFFTADGVFRSKGHIVLNPAYLPDGLLHKQYMKICLPMIDAAECVVVLPGWEGSNGAKVEYHYAKSAGLPIFEAANCCLNIKTGEVDFELGDEPICASVRVFDLTLPYEHISGYSLTVLSSGHDADMPQLNEF